MSGVTPEAIISPVQKVEIEDLVRTTARMLGSTMSSLDVYDFQCSGLVRTNERYIRCQDVAYHPVRDALASDLVPFGKHLLDAGTFTYHSMVSGGTPLQFVERQVYPYAAAAASEVVPVVQGSVVGPMRLGSAQEWVSSYANDKGELFSYVATASCTEDAVTVRLPGPRALGYPGTSDGNDGNYSDNIKPRVKLAYLDKFVTGTYASVNPITADILTRPEFTRSFQIKDIVGGAGIILSTHAISSDGVNVTVNMPILRGMSRCVLLVGGTSTGSFGLIRFYLAGEGNELVHVLCSAVRYGGSTVRWGETNTFIALDTPTSLTKHRYLAGTESLTMFPLSWNPLILNSYQFSSLTKTYTQWLSGDVLIRYTRFEVEVVCILGNIRKNDYRLMLEDGFGIWKKTPAARVTEIFKTWAAIPEAVAYRAETQPVSALSLKNTVAYKEYGKARAKACKTNNFLELEYNQEYLMKTVENKLTNLKALDVVAMDASLLGSAGVAPTKPAGASLPVVTISEDSVGSGLFNYSSTDGKSGRFSLSAESIGAMMDKVMPATFVGTLEPVNAALQSEGDSGSLADFGVSTGGPGVGTVTIDPTLSLHMSSIDMPLAPRLDQMGYMTTSEFTAFIASQLTDYAEFNTKLVPLIKSSTGDVITRAIVKQIGSYVESVRP